MKINFSILVILFTNRVSHLALYLFIALSIIILFQNCKTEKTSPTREEQVEQTAKDFFATFSEREDWEKFCSFYREDLYFEDLSLQIKLDSFWKFKRFYNWEAEGFKKLTPNQEHLSIESLVVNDSIAVARGHLNPFYYHGELIDEEWGMEFTIWLYFDENLKIKRQIDWMEYAPEVYESVIKRIREKGMHDVPEWLDLS